MSSEEQNLVVRAQAGDREALADLVEIARVRLFPAAYSQLRHYDDAQDAIAASLIQICMHLKDLRDPERALPWMLAIVKNEARRVRRARPPVLIDSTLAESAIDAEATPPALPSSLLRIDVERALYRLPWDEARTVALFYLKGQPIKEIARYLGRPEGTIKRWLHYGRRQLAHELIAYAPLTRPARRRLRRVLVHGIGGGAGRVALDPGRGRIYLAGEAGALLALDSTTHETIWNVSLGGTLYAVAVDSSGDRVYVAHAPADRSAVCGEATLLDADGSVRARGPVGNSPRSVALHRRTEVLFVVSAGENCVHCLDAENLQVRKIIDVGSEPLSAAIHPVSGRLYIANWGGCSVSVIDAGTLRVVKEIPVGAFPVDIAINGATNRVYVANSQDDTITVIDGSRDAVAETLPVERGPVSLAVNDRRNVIYVAHGRGNPAEGSIRVIDGVTNRVLATASVDSARPLVSVDSLTDQVYVAEEEIHSLSILQTG